MFHGIINIVSVCSKIELTRSVSRVLHIINLLLDNTYKERSPVIVIVSFGNLARFQLQKTSRRNYLPLNDG